MIYSRRPLPAYTYVPGKSPHPRSDPAGHSFGAPEPHVESFDVEQWEQSDNFLFGIDLFNAGYFWEAHEQWEAIWIAAGRTGIVADFFKGLIKLAAANVKGEEGNLVGVRRHGSRAFELFRIVNGQHTSMAGLELNELIQNAAQLRAANTYKVEFTLRMQLSS